MSTVYSPKVVIIIATAKQCMEAYITGCWERYAYGPVVGAMDEAISLMESKDLSIFRERPKGTSESLYHEADLFEQNSVDFDSGEIEEGEIVNIHYKNEQVDSFSVNFKETGDFDEFGGKYLGDCFFANRKMAEDALHGRSYYKQEG